MTRTPRVSETIRTATSHLRGRFPASMSRRALVATGAGLALAGAGAATATTAFTGTTAKADMLSPSVVAAARQHHNQVASSHSAAAGHASAKHASAKHASAKHASAKHASAKAAPAAHARTWAAVSRIVAQQTAPKAPHGSLPAQDQLTPAGTTGPQTWMPMTSSQYANVKAIVGQALAKHMGLRSAVIAVATAMQESGLQNISYGTSDSVGLFQQRPSMGWGTASQIMHPAYAADAFLSALRTYQHGDPGWARQPLWQTAQGVQRSGFPTAYAKWEAQAAHLVQSVTRQMV